MAIMHAGSVGLILGGWLCAVAIPQQDPVLDREPVPPSEQTAAAGQRGLAVVSALLAESAGSPDQAIDLLERASRGAVGDAPLAFALLAEALRLAQRHARIDRGLLVIESMARRFVIERSTRQLKFLAGVESSTSVPQAALIDAHLRVAERLKNQRWEG